MRTINPADGSQAWTEPSAIVAALISAISAPTGRRLAAV